MAATVDAGLLNATTCKGTPPGVVANGAFSCNGTFIGRVCLAKCADTFAGSPTPSTICLFNGSWAAVTGLCARECVMHNAPVFTTYGALHQDDVEPDVLQLVDIPCPYTQKACGRLKPTSGIAWML